MSNYINKDKIQELIKNGVIILDPNNTFIDETCSIGSGTIIHPFVIINQNVTIKNNCTIYSFNQIQDNVVINDNVKIGQHSLIREHVNIGMNTTIGPHCEITRTVLGCNCAIGHKNYLGDAILMDGVKFGAGVIIANTNWQEHFKTIIGSNTKVGINCSLIAPLKIGNNCFIAAGVTLKNELEDNKFVRNDTSIVIKDNKLK